MQIRKLNLIAPDLYQEKLCSTFAKNSAINQREYYKTKGERGIAKLEYWTYNGKMSEYAVFNTLLSFPNYKKVSPPDIMIYERNRKSHDADIVSDDKLIHVKSCIVVDGREPSWLFSTEDKIVTKPSENDIVAFVMMSVPKLFEAYFVKATDLIGKYKEPFNATTIAHAIYESDLIEG